MDKPLCRLSHERVLKSAVKKRHYYYTSPDGCRLFELALGPLALVFTGERALEAPK